MMEVAVVDELTPAYVVAVEGPFKWKVYPEDRVPTTISRRLTCDFNSIAAGQKWANLLNTKRKWGRT